MLRVFDRVPNALVGYVPVAWIGLAVLDAWIVPGAILYWISTWPGKGALLGAVAACGCLWWGLTKTGKAVFGIDGYRWTVLWLGKLALILIITTGLMRLVWWAQG